MAARNKAVRVMVAIVAVSLIGTATSGAEEVTFYSAFASPRIEQAAIALIKKVGFNE